MSLLSKFGCASDGYWSFEFKVVDGFAVAILLVWFGLGTLGPKLRPPGAHAVKTYVLISLRWGSR